VCLILDANYERALCVFESPDLTPLDFFFVGLDEERSLQKKVDTRDELLARIFDVAAPIKEREYQLRRAIRDFRARDAKCLDVYDGILEHLL
jgi:hypothetical protein